MNGAATMIAAYKETVTVVMKASVGASTVSAWYCSGSGAAARSRIRSLCQKQTAKAVARAISE